MINLHVRTQINIRFMKVNKIVIVITNVMKVQLL